MADDHLLRLQQRIDRVMLGEAQIDYDKMLMQLNPASGEYGDLARSKSFKKSTLNYRKIKDLKFDSVFFQYIQRPIYRNICARVYGANTPVACCRAMFMNKPACKGTFLSWHQDHWSRLDRDPQLTVWTAMDPATIQNGFVQIISGSHQRGVINRNSPASFLTKEQVERHCSKDEIVFLELEAVEVMLLHNYLLHASDVNRSNQSRRAFSVCYMDARTKTVHNKDETFSIIFDNGCPCPLSPNAAPISG